MPAGLWYVWIRAVNCFICGWESGNEMDFVSTLTIASLESMKVIHATEADG